MRRFLLSISLMLCGVTAFATGTGETFFPTAEGRRAEYAVTMDFGRAHLTGICVMKCIDGTIVGTLMNEFGIRAFDFRCDGSYGGTELSNLTGPLDRWYIRRTLRRDLRLLLQHADNGTPQRIRGRRIELRGDGSLSLTHIRRGLTLVFTPLNE